MGGVISIGESEEDVWLVAGWAYRGVLDHLREAVKGQADLEQAIGKAEIFQALSFDRLEPGIADRLARALLCIIDEIVAGMRQVQVDGRILDETRQTQFREAAAELRPVIVRWAGPPPPG